MAVNVVAQSVNQAQNLDELGSGDSSLRELECDAVAMKCHLGTDLDELVAQRGQGPVLDLQRQRQSPFVAEGIEQLG